MRGGARNTERNTMSTKRNTSVSLERVSIPTEEEIKKISDLADAVTRLNHAAVNARVALCNLYELMANLRIC